MAKKQITIIGCGLVGGSMSMALRLKRPDWTIVALDVPDRIPSIVDAGVADQVASVDEISSFLPDSSVVILAATVGVIIRQMALIAPHLQRGTIVSDVGSTKFRIMERAKSDLPDGIHFIGGHPIAGSEKSGVAAADPLLFKNRPYLLCPDPDTPADALLTLIDIVDDLSAVPVTLDAVEHDDMLAIVSHVPHLLAIALVHAAMENDASHGLLESIAGRGFLDLTRIAGSDYEMWSSILNTNCDSIGSALDRFAQSLRTVRSSMDQGNLATIWKEVSHSRRNMNVDSSTRVRMVDLRTHIDHWDEQLMKALGKRLSAVSKLGKVKHDYRTPVYDSDRERRMMSDRLEWASSLGLPPDLVERLFEIIIDHCRNNQSMTVAEKSEAVVERLLP